VIAVVEHQTGKELDLISMRAGKAVFRTGVARGTFASAKRGFGTEQETFEALIGSSNGYLDFRQVELG
jgi:hypothetical protein